MPRPRKLTYVGLDADAYGGMTPTGTIIRDAWVFGLLAEDEACTGWSYEQIQALYDRVSAAWEPYGHLVGRLSPEFAERHRRIYGAATGRARTLGWPPPLDEGD